MFELLRARPGRWSKPRCRGSRAESWSSPPVVGPDSGGAGSRCGVQVTEAPSTACLDSREKCVKMRLPGEHRSGGGPDSRCNDRTGGRAAWRTASPRRRWPGDPHLVAQGPGRAGLPGLASGHAATRATASPACCGTTPTPSSDAPACGRHWRRCAARCPGRRLRPCSAIPARSRSTPRLASSDVQRFRDLTRDGSPHALAEAAERYAGELLPGFDARSPAFDAWIDEHRRALRREWVQALQRYAVQCVASADLGGATEALSRLVSVEPANESAQRDLMGVYARRGLYTEALRQYRACTRGAAPRSRRRPGARDRVPVSRHPATPSGGGHGHRRARTRGTGDGRGGARSGSTPRRGEPGVTPAPPVTTLKEVVVLVARTRRRGCSDG